MSADNKTKPESSLLVLFLPGDKISKMYASVKEEEALQSHTSMPQMVTQTTEERSHC